MYDRRVLIQSDGTPWRPLVHIEDISRAFLAVLEAPRDAVHNQAFNVGSRRRTIRFVTSPTSSSGSWTVLGRIPGGRRPRSALLSCQLRQVVAAHSRFQQREWTVREASRSTTTAYKRHGLTSEMFATLRPVEADPGAAGGRSSWTPRFAGSRSGAV